MTIHLLRQIEKLKSLILSLGEMVQQNLNDAITAIENHDPDLAKRVIEADEKIDSMEIEVEEECLHTLALHQPVAMDLRYVVAVLKINNDLERIGDLATNIAQQATFMAKEDPLEDVPFDMPAMAQMVQTMLQQSLEALVNSDTELAQQVRRTDDRVDDIHRVTYDKAERLIDEHPKNAPQIIHQINVSRQLERIADHATNIAEDVIYTVEGQISRHTVIP